MIQHKFPLQTDGVSHAQYKFWVLMCAFFLGNSRVWILCIYKIQTPGNYPEKST